MQKHQLLVHTLAKIWWEKPLIGNDKSFQKVATEQQNKPFLSASVMSVNGTEFPAVKNIVKDPLLRILQKNYVRHNGRD